MHINDLYKKYEIVFCYALVTYWGSTHGVKNLRKCSVHLACASLFCRLWVELAQVQNYNDATCNIFVS